MLIQRWAGWRQLGFNVTRELQICECCQQIAHGSVIGPLLTFF